MTQCKERDFEKMYVELFPKMRNFAIRLCRNRDDAEDITQEAFVKAYRAYETCDGTHKVDNWLMRIVYHTFLDRKRAKSRRVQECGDTINANESAIEGFADPRCSPEEALVREVISPQLLSAIAALDADSRKLMHEIYIEKMGQEELSKQYGIKIGALRSRIHRITLKLRSELKPALRSR